MFNSQNKVLDDSSFYVLKNIDGRIEDMDSRISDDVNKFCEVVSEMWSQFALPLGRILVFSARFARTVEWAHLPSHALLPYSALLPHSAH